MNYLDRFRLDGRNAVITGAGRGIGLACAEALAQAGAEVLLLDVDPDLAAEAAHGLRSLGYRASSRACDVSSSTQVRDIANGISSASGKVDILVNNAGISISDVPAERMTDEQWLRVLDVNLNGTFWCCREFGKLMLEVHSGSIVNIGSMSGFIVNRPQSQAQYNASKAAVHHLTKSLAAEWAELGIRVNAVAPTYIETAMSDKYSANNDMYRRWIDGTPMGRMGKDYEVASTVLFLASDAASLLTGSIVSADGGYTAW